MPREDQVRLEDYLELERYLFSEKGALSGSCWH